MTAVATAPATAPVGADACGVSSSPHGLVAEYANSDHCRIVRETFSRVGDKWSLLVIAILARGPQRFGALKVGVVGISQRMLTLTLRTLERDGIVTRTAFPEVPPRVEYALTPLGRAMVEPVTALADWAVASYDEITSNQQRYDREHGEGSSRDARRVTAARGGG